MTSEGNSCSINLVRKVSYNLQIITLCALLFVFIAVTYYLTSRVSTQGNINLQVIILVIEIFLIGLVIFFMKYYLNFIKGDDGEMAVKFILDKLQGYYYLPDVMIGDGKRNIDGVVIGPTGIWAIEVKNYRKKEIKLDRYLLKDIENTKREMKPLQEMLNIPVTPVLVFANKAKIDFGMVPQYGVYVIGKPWLEELITKTSKTVLTSEQCFAIKEKLKPYSSKIN